MNNINVIRMQQKLEKERLKQRDTRNETDRNIYQEVRNELKKTIKTTKASFLRK